MAFHPHIVAAALKGTPPAAPSISGTVLKNGVLTITPGVGLAPTSYRLYRNGVFARTVTAPDVFVLADCSGQAITVKAVANGVEGPASNTLTFSVVAIGWVPWDESDVNNTVTGGKYQQLVDQRTAPPGALPLDAPAPGQRPNQVLSPQLAGTPVAAGGVSTGTDPVLTRASLGFAPLGIALLCRTTGFTNPNYYSLSHGVSANPCIRPNTSFPQYEAGGAISVATDDFADFQFRMLGCFDNGSTAVDMYTSNPALDAWVGHDPKAAVAARPAADRFSLLAYQTGSFGSEVEHAACAVKSTTPTLAELESIREFWRATHVDLLTLPRTPWIGTLSTPNTQPRPIPSGHNGYSGATIQTLDTSLNGLWTVVGDYALGSPGDPGPGNRGAIETLQLAGASKVTLYLVIGSADTQAPFSPLTPGSTQTMILRIASIFKGALDCVVVQYVLPLGTNPPYSQANADTYNALLPTMRTNLAGLGVRCVLVPVAPGFTIATDMIDGGVGNTHLTPTGVTRQSSYAITVMAAESLAILGPSSQFLTAGQSNISGVVGPSCRGACAQLRGGLAVEMRSAGY